MWFYLLAVYFLLNIMTSTYIMKHSIFLPVNVTYKTPSITVRNLVCWTVGSKICIITHL